MTLAHMAFHEEFKSTDAWAMTQVDWLDKSITPRVQFLVDAEVPFLSTLLASQVRTHLDSGAAWDEGRVTVVTLTPASHSFFFGRRSPLPREVSAELISAFASRLKQLRVDGAQGRKPVVGLDFDVTPVECEQRGRLVRTPSGAPACPSGPATKRMREALQALQEEAYVVAVVYPRSSAAARAERNDFIRADCDCALENRTADEAGALGRVCTRAAGRSRPAMLYASAQVMQPPLGWVTEFPTRLKSGAEWEGVELPPRFPSLGASMAFRYQTGRGMQLPAEQYDAAGYYCRLLRKQGLAGGAPPASGDAAGALMDDMIADGGDPRALLLPNQYEYDTIGFGKAQLKVQIEPIDPPDEFRRQGAAPADLKPLFREALAELQSSDHYIIAVDSNSTEDKFRVPVLRMEVPGAWLHAAIAVSGAVPEHSAEQPGLEEKHERKERYWHWLVDVAMGLILALCCDPVRRISAARYPVVKQVLVAVWPVCLALLLTWVAFRLSAIEFVQGRWSSPLLLSLGYVAHIYLDAPSGDAGHSEVAPSLLDQWLALLFQLAWCVLMACTAWMVWIGHVVLPGLLACGLLGLCAAAYFSAARQWHFLPLAWRHS